MLRAPMFVFCTVVILLLNSDVAAQLPPDLRQEADRISGPILLGTQAMDSLEELTDTIGPRLAGSTAYDRAARWAAEKFRSYGIANVRLESFTIPNGWERGWARGQIVSPIARRLNIESVGWSPPTPAGGINAEVIVFSDVSPGIIKTRAGEIKGRVVLLDHTQMFARDEREALIQIRTSYQRFHDAGAVSVLLADNLQINNVLGGWVDNDNYQGRVLPLPVAEIGQEDNKLILRFLKRGPVRLQFEYQNQVTGPVPVNNVIAEIPGEHPDEWVLVGAHLDSWDYGTGAQDDGTGVVMVLEAARAIAALGKRPRRSIRFALFGAEEPGPPGSKAYIQAHASELPNCVAMLNTDDGAARAYGWRVFRPDLRRSMEPISNAVLKDLGGDQLTEEVVFAGDDESFFLQRVPTLSLWTDTSHYSDFAHKQGDTFDKVDPVYFKTDAAVVAVTAYAIAQTQTAIGPHLTHAEIGAILRNANLEKYLIELGFWNP
jgi:carboxypeptidase Q